MMQECWVQKITIAPLKNGLSLNFTLPNIESAAIPIQKTIAAYGWVHLPFLKSVDFTAFAVSVKTIALKKYLYQFGHAIWWGEAPRIVSTFVESYDFSGKTIIPFCTSGGSGIGSSATNLEQLTDGADWLSGKRLNGSDSQDTVMEWVNSLGLDFGE